MDRSNRCTYRGARGPVGGPSESRCPWRRTPRVRFLRIGPSRSCTACGKPPRHAKSPGQRGCFRSPQCTRTGRPSTGLCGAAKRPPVHGLHDTGLRARVSAAARRGPVRGTAAGSPRPGRRPRSVHTPACTERTRACAATRRPDDLGPRARRRVATTSGGQAELATDRGERVAQRYRLASRRGRVTPIPRSMRPPSTSEAVLRMDDVGQRRPRSSATSGRAAGCAPTRAARVRVELAEHVVEQQHRCRAGELAARPRGRRAATRARACAARPATPACARRARRSSSANSSRCGPTSVSPRSISAAPATFERVAQRAFDRRRRRRRSAARAPTPPRSCGRDRPRRRRQRLVRLGDRRREPFDELQPAAHQLGAGVHELLVEHVEGRRARRRRARRRAATRCAASAPVRSRCGPRRSARASIARSSSRYVAAFGGPALHQREVVGREHRDAQQAVQIARPRDRLCLLHRMRLRPATRISASKSCVPRRRRRPRRARSPGRARAHEQRVGDAAERPGARDPTDRLEQAGLALPVRAVQHREPGRELEIDVA